MKKKIIFVIAFVIALTAVCGWFSLPAPAGAQVGVKVSPVRVDEIVDPGETLDVDMKITNNSNVPKTFYAYLRDFTAEGESGEARLIVPGTEEGSFMSSWVEITTDGIDFAPGETKTVPYKINVPENAGPGGYYGAILFGTAPPKLALNSADKGAGMAVAQQTGSLILLQVKGDVYEEARVREFNTDKGIYGTPFDVNFLVRIENLGNVHVKPIGLISIKNMFGKEVAQIQVNDAGANVLPKSIRRFEYDWNGDLAFGHYQASLGLSYGTATDRGGQGKRSLFTEISFWIVPWKIIIPAFCGLIFFGGMLFLLLRLYKNKAVRRAMEQAGLGHTRYVPKFEGPSPTLHLILILLIVFIIMFLVVGSVYLIFFA